MENRVSSKLYGERSVDPQVSLISQIRKNFSASAKSASSSDQFQSPDRNRISRRTGCPFQGERDEDKRKLVHLFLRERVEVQVFQVIDAVACQVPLMNF